MKTYIKITILAVVICFVSSCSDDYFDVNTPSGTATLDQLQMNDLLGPAIYHTVYAQFSAERTIGNYSQYFTSQGGNAAGATSMSGTWSNTYLYALPSLKSILEKAKEKNSTDFSGIAKILTAVNIGFATDFYDNIPYSQAAGGSSALKPSFDSQENIYKAITVLLDEAIAEISGDNPSGIKPTSSGDIFYKGDMDKWLRAAYSLKARYAMHLTEVDGSTAVQVALEALANGFQSNADDMLMFFSDRNINPWHSRQVLAPNTGNAHDKVGDQLVSYMNGSSYPFTTISYDPRLPMYADNSEGGDTPYRGYVSGGQGASSDGEAGNTDFADEGYYTSVGSPMILMSCSEVQFLKAEAEFLANGGDQSTTGANSASYDAYMAGIAANMERIGVDGAAYMAEESINVGAEKLMLHHIMKEKYIANFLNPETFVDMRRYDFSDEVFKDLALPLDNAESEFPGQWLVRANYPSREATRNPENVSANAKSPVDPVWWDR